LINIFLKGGDELWLVAGAVEQKRKKPKKEKRNNFLYRWEKTKQISYRPEVDYNLSE